MRTIIKLPGKFLILSDSLSAVKSLQKLNLSSHYLLQWIYTLIVAAPQNKIVIEWIPSHVGIQGNESADCLAVSSLKLPGFKSIPLSNFELRRQIKETYTTKWQELWTSMPEELRSFKPELGATAFEEEPRIIQLPLTRIRLNTTLLTHDHYFKKTPREECEDCHITLTIKHLLIDCPTHNEHRKDLEEVCRMKNLPFNVENITSPEVPAQLTIDFLKKSNFLEKI